MTIFIKVVEKSDVKNSEWIPSFPSLQKRKTIIVFLYSFCYISMIMRQFFLFSGWSRIQKSQDNRQWNKQKPHGINLIHQRFKTWGKLKNVSFWVPIR